MKNLSYLLCAFLLAGCGFLAVIDPPKNKDFFKGEYAVDSFHNPFSDGIFMALDSACGPEIYEKSIILWEFKNNRMHHMSAGGLTYPVSYDSTVNFYRRFIRKNDIGYAVKITKDSFLVDLRNRDAPGIFHFHRLGIKIRDSNNFDAYFIETIAYKFPHSSFVYRCHSEDPLHFVRYRGTH